MRSSTPVDNNSMGLRRRGRLMDDIRVIDTRDYELLKKFTTEHGRIIPSRFTGTTPKQQRQVARAIKRARTMGLVR